LTALTPDQLDALRTVRAAFPEAKIALIGATALGLHLDMTWRTSVDLDLAIAVAMSDIDATKLPGWQRDRRRQHRWQTPAGVLLDIVPAPSEALESRELVWPDTGLRMNLTGIGFALEADTSRLGSELSVAVPSVALIALLKMTAYTDRPEMREKDLNDLAHILDEYPSSDDDRMYSTEVLAIGLHVPEAQAFVLGRELRNICAEKDREVIERFLRMMDDGVRWTTFVNASPWRNDEERLSRKLDALRRGFNQD
jgi:predicted nucleotidyltransferase